MRRMLAAALGAAALFAAGSAAADDPRPGWSYAYTDGVAAATLNDDRGRPVATLTCRPPTGDIVITDYTLEREARRVTTASVKLGALAVNVPVTRVRVGRKWTAQINLPQRPPFLAGARETDDFIVTINNRAHTYRTGAAKQMQDVAYACWGS